MSERLPRPGARPVHSVKYGNNQTHAQKLNAKNIVPALDSEEGGVEFKVVDM